MTERNYRQVDPCQIESFVPEEQREREIKVVYADSRLPALTVSIPEAFRLARRGMVAGWVNKHGYLRYLIAITSVHLIHRFLHGMRRPPLPSGVISKMRQDNGAAIWVQRADNAHGGLIGSRAAFQWEYAAERGKPDRFPRVPR